MSDVAFVHPVPSRRAPRCSISRLESIRDEVCRQTKVGAREIKESYRSDRLVRARHVLIMLCHYIPAEEVPSLSQINSVVNKHHTTIISALRRMEQVAHATMWGVGPDATLAKWVSVALREYDRFMAPEIERRNEVLRRRIRLVNVRTNCAA